MGNVCMAEDRVFRKIDEYTHPDSFSLNFKRAQPRYSRFGNVQKISTKKTNGYKLIMATNSVKLSTVSIECRIMQSSAEFQLYDGTKFELLDKSVSPLIDIFNPNPNQIYHPIKTYHRSNLTLKVYPFSGYNHTTLKRAVHEVWIYNELRSMSPLVDAFIMTRGKTSAFVMTFKNYEVSLLEIVRYRQLADYHWTEAELVTLWKILISNYKNLKNLSICHREIRLGKIFYTSDNKNQPYQFANLETARKVERSDVSDLLTVVGVNIFAESPMREKIENEQELAMYDPFAYDVQCLVRVLLSLLNLDPLQSQSLQCKNTNLSPIIQKLKSNQPNFTQIQKHLDDILRTLVYQKTDLFREDKIISDHLIKSQLRLKNRDRIDQAYFDALLELHKKQVFNRILIDKIQENDNLNKRYDNIAILHKVGEYYKKIGLEKNQYFDEQFSLLLDLTKQCREQEFHQDHTQYLAQLTKLQQGVSKQRTDLDIKYSNQLIYKFMNQGKLDGANQCMSELLEKIHKYDNVQINTQIDVLTTKCLLELQNQKYQNAQNTIERISYIITSSTFDNQYDAKRYQGEVEYLKANFQITIMNKNKEEIKKKRVGTAEAAITSALAIFTNLPQSNTNTIKIINAYILKSSLSDIKEAYPQSKASLESADILIAEIQKNRSVSDSLKLRLLQRLKTVYEKSNKANEGYYKQILNRLGKINKSFEYSNAARHQRFKQEKAQVKQKVRKERMRTADPYAIVEEQQEDEAQ